MSDSRVNEFRGKESDISKLIRDGADDQTAIAHLKSKYNDKELVAKAFSEFEERMSKIKHKAQKFAQLVITRYSHLGTKRIMEKALKLKKKWGFPDDDFSAFVRIALSDTSLAQNSSNVIPNTPLSKLFGYTQESAGKMNVKTNDLSTLQEILKVHNDNLVLHQQVVTQSLLYTDCATQALLGHYDNKRHTPYNYVHPIVAAFFLPRIKYIDEHLIIGSISNVVQSRYNGTQIRNNPDWELYWDIMNDPNEVACAATTSNPIADLKSRVVLQVELWKQVRELRQSRYFDVDAGSFTTALFNCRNNIFDAPDMSFVKDEGAILRKLFGAFSLRPTIVSLSSLNASQMTGSYSINPLAMTQVSTVPIINYRLPVIKTNAKYKLESALTQPDWYVENKMLIPKTKQIIYSRDIIVFYVSRRNNSTLNYANLVEPYNFSRLPTAFSGFESINTTSISYEPAITIGNELFKLKSCVFLESTELTNVSEDKYRNIIVGCSAGIVLDNTKFNKEHVSYSPLNASRYDEDDDIKQQKSTSGIKYFGSETQSTGNLPSFASKFETHGTIYVFVKQTVGSSSFTL